MRAAPSVSLSRDRATTIACTARTSCGQERRYRAGQQIACSMCAISIEDGRSRVRFASLVAVFLLLIGLLLREQVDPIVCIGWPMTAGSPRAARHRHQHERAQSLDQALAYVGAIPGPRHVLRRGAMIEWMPICEQN